MVLLSYSNTLKVHNILKLWQTLAYDILKEFPEEAW